MSNYTACLNPAPGARPHWSLSAGGTGECARCKARQVPIHEREYRALRKIAALLEIDKSEGGAARFFDVWRAWCACKNERFFLDASRARI